MNPQDSQDDLLGLINLWGPRILVGLSILLLIYFTNRTDNFKGLFDESFLAQDNLILSRGPLAKKVYYERGMLTYQPKELFTSEKRKALEAAEEAEIEAGERGEVPVQIEEGVQGATAPITKPTS